MKGWRSSQINYSIEVVNLTKVYSGEMEAKRGDELWRQDSPPKVMLKLTRASKPSLNPIMISYLPGSGDTSGKFAVKLVAVAAPVVVPMINHVSSR